MVIAGLSVGLVSLGSCATKVDNTSPDSKVEDIEQCDELPTEPGEDWEMGEVVICDEDTANSDNEDTILNESNGRVTPILVMGEDVFDEDSRFSDNECSAEDKIYSMAMVDVCPEFPGGTQAMYKWLKNNLKYSQEAVADSVEGKVIVEFVINENGKIENSHILRGKHPFLDKEAIRLVRMMPQWTPGEINGKKVKVSYTLPVTFKLPK